MEKRGSIFRRGLLIPIRAPCAADEKTRPDESASFEVTPWTTATSQPRSNRRLRQGFLNLECRGLPMLEQQVC